MKIYRVGGVGIQVAAAIALIVILLIPVMIYKHTFGSVISNNVNDWASMGSAMSGIYGPILSVLTLIVVVVQVSLQRRTTELQQRTTELQQDTAGHMYDQAYIQDARADIEFYLTTMVRLVDGCSNEVVPRKVLREKFVRATKVQLSTVELMGVAYMVEREFPQLQATWSALNAILGGLDAGARFPYDLQLISAKQKAVAMLSYGTCRALDNYLYCISEGKIGSPYLFSPILAKDG